MCCKPIIIEQWYDRLGNFHSTYFADFNPQVHNDVYFSRIRWTHSVVGRRKHQFVVVPCGKCEDCVRVRARDWKVRLYHHSITEGEGIFVTLTYNDEHLDDNNLDYSHFQLFMKRLRHLFPDNEISYFCAGEYGSDTLRRHFHAIIFGIPLDAVKTKYLCRSRRNKRIKIWTSSVLEKCWCVNFSRKETGYTPSDLRGFVSVSRVTHDDPSAFGYVAGYIICKYNSEHRSLVSLNKMVPEMHHMSLKRAIGKSYFIKNCKRIFDNDFIWFNCRKLPVPKAYDRWFKQSTERTVIKRLLCPKNIFDFFTSKFATVISKMDFVFNYLKHYDISLDKVSDFDIIKSRRKLRFLASTGKKSFYHYDAKLTNLKAVYNGYNSSRCLYNL